MAYQEYICCQLDKLEFLGDVYEESKNLGTHACPMQTVFLSIKI